MISFKNVHFSYGKKSVLTDFNLQINKGDRVALCGESGVGKTTVLRLIMGLEKAVKGTVVIDGDKKITAVFQEDRLLPFKTVMQNLTLFGNGESAKKILSELGLLDVADKYPSALSGGMARRISIARALNSGGDIFIFDEPFNGIDEENVKLTAALIKHYTDNKTVVMVSHNKRDITAVHKFKRNVTYTGKTKYLLGDNSTGEE